MLLFKPEHEQPIRERRKTQTRRFWKRCRVLVGSIHQCYTRPAYARPPGKPFASVRITAHRVERIGEISEADVRAEGYETREGYMLALARINKLPTAGLEDLEVHVVDFELVESASS